MDLEVAGAHRRLDARSLAAHLVERPRHGRLARPEEAQDPVLGGRTRSRMACTGAARERGRPEPLKLPGRSRQRDRDAPLVLEKHRRSGSRQAERDGTLRKRGLLGDAGGEVAERAPETLATPRETASISRSSRRRARGRGRCPGRASRPSGRRASARGRRRGCRARPPAPRERRLELVGPVSDDEDARRLEPAAGQLLGEKGPVQRPACRPGRAHCP